MPSLRLKIQYNKNDGTLISPSELQEKYLFGIPVCTTDGRKIPSSTLLHQIKAAQKRIENLFSIKLNKQVIEENIDFIREEFNSWGFVKSMYPIAYIANLKGYINDVCQTDYPREWLSIKKNESVAVYRNVYLIPNSGSEHGSTMSQNSVIYNGISPHLGWFGEKRIPNYWRLKYITGWDDDNLPEDLCDMISKYAAINVLAIIGDYLYGVGLGSISVSLDGVSQTTPLTRSGKYGMFGNRIQLYMDDINNMMETLRYVYKGITFMVL
jgi:hypothetical protein